MTTFIRDIEWYGAIHYPEIHGMSAAMTNI